MTSDRALSSEPIRVVIQRAIDAGYMPGAVWLVADGDRASAGAAGRRWFGGPPMATDAVFRIASLTKPICAALAMSLLEEGVLSLGAAVQRWLPELADRRVLRSIDAELDNTVPAQRPITVEDLLSFRLGFGSLLVPPGTYPIQRVEEELDLKTLRPPWPPTGLSRDEWIERFASLPLLAQPGERWMYHTGSHVLGVLVERATGQSLGEVLRSRILEPCAMADTTFTLSADQQARFTAFYASEPGADGQPVQLDGVEGGYWSAPPMFPDAGGWLLSTAEDLWRFARMIRGGGTFEGRRVLRAESVTAMGSNHITDAQRADAAPFLSADIGWGYGMAAPLRTDRGFAASLGWAGGSGTLWLIDQGRDCTAIMLTQRELGSPESASLFDSFLTAAEDSLAG